MKSVIVFVAPAGVTSVIDNPVAVTEYETN